MTGSEDPKPTTLLELKSVTRRYELTQSWLPFRKHASILACDNVDLDVREGEIVGLVGESGSGKSTLARIAILLERPDSGRVLFEAADLTKLRPSALRRIRRKFQIVFQDSLSALNPRWRIGDSIAHPLIVHSDMSRRAIRTEVGDLLKLVELPETFAGRHPHELSGGQRQRACIARALALRPKLIVADEPVSGLDVSTQAQILELLHRVNAESKTAFLLISHDLRIIRHMSSRVAVMTAGQIVEFRATPELFAVPEHPYTKKLIASVPRRRYDFRRGPDNGARSIAPAG
jgi:ABC-type glutathione transport system ATPase component